jgi:hypothetical protein
MVRGKNLVPLRQKKSSFLSRDLGSLTVSMVVSELGQTGEMLDNGWN